MARLLRQRITWRLPALIASEAILIVGAVTLSAQLSLAEPLSLAHVAKAALIAVVFQMCLYYAELYEFRVLSDRRELFVRFLQALGWTSLLLAATYFVAPNLVVGQGVFLLASIFTFVAVVSWRVVFEWLARDLGKRERLLLVGTNAAAVSLARELYHRTDIGVQIVGFIDPDPARVGEPVINPGVIGTIEDIPRIVRALDVDRVVVSLAEARGRLPMDKLLEMKLDGVTFDHLASLYEEYTGKIAVENLRPSWFIFSDGFRKSRVLPAVKRAIDVVAACLGLVFVFPVMVAVGLAVKMTSPGPAMFTQRRVGRAGCVFVLYKFRSMHDDAEGVTGAVWASRNDPRVTPIGRVLRRSRLDELPQLWNVLRGDMSLVGPRPERPEFVSDLTRQIPFYGQRHVVKPGVTGWAQVRHCYGASVEDAMEKLQYDLFYIKNLSIALDLFILFKTVQTVILRRGH